MQIEHQLKTGQLPAIIATSSLELGIDMGAVDLVIWNEDQSGYRQTLQDQIMGVISSVAEASLLDKPGGLGRIDLNISGGRISERRVWPSARGSTSRPILGSKRRMAVNIHCAQWRNMQKEQFLRNYAIP